ncbi:hypothetical protein Goshw_005220, partial [Gossypium schwendimanii]|nr:hypothetical protein [Gossypium schwendimanii]
PEISWRDKVLGREVPGYGREDLELLDGDVTRCTVNGIPVISFSERVQQILFREMATTVVVKLLGRNLSYSILQNRIQSLRKLSQQFHLMDLENGLSDLPGFLYKRQILEKVRGLIGTVIKLDFQMDKGSTGKFARMAVGIERQPLVSQIMVNGGPSKEMDMGVRSTKEDLLKANKVGEVTEPFGPWMIVERKSRRNPQIRQSLETKGPVINASNLLGRKMVVNSMMEADLQGGADFLDVAERIEVSGPTRKDSGNLSGLLVVPLNLDNKALEYAGNLVSVGPGLTAQGDGGLVNTISVDNLTNVQ